MVVVLVLFLSQIVGRSKCRTGYVMSPVEAVITEKALFAGLIQRRAMAAVLESHKSFTAGNCAALATILTSRQVFVTEAVGMAITVKDQFAITTSQLAMDAVPVLSQDKRVVQVSS
jgi:hypothetical protein